MTTLESKYLLVERALTEKNLLALIQNEIQVLRIPNFIDSHACQVISNGLKSHGYNDYLNAP